MLKVITIAAVSALALAVTTTSNPAYARDGGVAAGVIGGLAAGAIIGSAAANSNYYRGPGYYQDYGYAPAYGACHTERQQVVDEYGRVHFRRVRVCD